VTEPSLTPVRVEKALGLLPEIEALEPLRALLVSISRPDERTLWSSSGPYLTLGKRGVQPEELRHRMPPVFHAITEHLQGLYGAYVEALECQQRADGTGAVAALLRAGRSEERVARLNQARAWYDVALRLSQGLQDRRPEVESLRSLGELFTGLGQYAEAARHFQRALAIAEAEFDQAGAVAACEGLGHTALALGQGVGARAWYARGLRLAEAAGDQRQIGRLERYLGELARQQGEATSAGEHLRRARECLEAVDATEEMAALLNTQGLLEAQLGRHAEASRAYREALAWVQRVSRDAGLEVTIRLSLAELHLEAGRFLDGEEEMRRAEQVAIADNLTGRLVQIYTVMGRLRGRQLDETGFVFFEQAIELSRMLERSPAAVAQVYLEYGLFRERLGQRDEARAYLERAREIFGAVGDALDRDRVDAELQKITA